MLPFIENFWKKNKSINLFLEFLAIIIVVFTSVNSMNGIIMGLIITITIFSFQFLNTSYLNMTYVFVLVLLFINFIFLVLSNSFSLNSASTFKYFYVFCRDILIYVLFFYLILKRLDIFTGILKRNLIDRIAFIFLLMGIVYLILPIGHIDFNLKLGSFKQIFNFVFLFFIGRMLAFSESFNENSIKKLSRLIISLGVIFSVYGIMEIFILPYFLGMDPLLFFGGDKYLSLMFGANSDIYGGGTINISGLTGNFYSPAFGMSIRRASSLLIDPVALSFFLSFVLVLNFCYSKTKVLNTILISSCLILTLGKGGILTSLVSITFWALVRFKKIGKLVAFLTFGISAGLFTLFLRTDSSVMDHLNGLTNGVKDFIEYPLGKGLGSSGNLATLVAGSNNNNLISGGESTVGSLLSQIGILGGLLFILLIVLLMLRIKAIKFTNDNQNQLKIFLSGLLMGGFSASLFSEGVFQFNALGLLFLFIAAMISVSEKSKKFF
ncbi:hypothetical protein GCM10007968_21580 [Sporolactobacillus putidus]|uniref:Uncharacterized protein n=2 Tax=Sporolactobacillus putidus TaxID=492735 RepID=A0A917S4E1_9BACL|nr:hypothetical protein GCM10007968_21580 [Sporolactobacillus putidus]